MDSTYRPKLKWSRISYVILSVVLTSTVLASFSEHNAYAKGIPYSGEYTRNQFIALMFIPLIVIGGLVLMAAIARKSLSVTVDN